MPRLSAFRTTALLGFMGSLIGHGFAIPLSRRAANIPALSADQIASFKPFSFYAAMGYCQPSTVLASSCGRTCQIRFPQTANLALISENCDANPSFQPIAAGGDGSDVQFWYVGIDPTLEVRKEIYLFLLYCLILDMDM